MFNLAQFLGYIEVVRREGPREDAFLQAGNPQGSDTLATLVEGLRFVMSAASGNLVVSQLAKQHNPCQHDVQSSRHSCSVPAANIIPAFVFVNLGTCLHLSIVAAYVARQQCLLFSTQVLSAACAVHTWV